MKTEIIFWLNTNNGIIYHKTYRDTIFRKVGEENQFNHVILAIARINEKKLKCYNSGLEMLKSLVEEPKKKKIKNVILDNIIDILTKLNKQ